MTQYSSLVITCVFWAAIFCINANATHKEFVSCMNNLIILPPNNSTYLFTPDMPIYSTLVTSPHNPRLSNLTTSLKPTVIVIPHNEAEIQAAITCSQKHRLQVRVRSGGHDYEGLSYLCKTPFVLIDMRNLRSISIDIEDETAWVESGATLGELYYSIAQKSQTHGFPAGVCPSVGVGGHLSGGGFGNLVRKYGLAADNIIDAYLVDAKGWLLDREAMGEDLFWAIRGGGGANFGIIVSWKIRLVRVPEKVTVFNVYKSLDDRSTTEIIHRWQHVMPKIKKELFIRVIIQYDRYEKNASVKALFNTLFLGELEDLITLMNTKLPELGLRPKDCIEMSWIDSVSYFASFANPELLIGNETDPYVSYFKAKSDFVTKPIPKQVFKRIRKRFLQQQRVFLILEPFGGRMNEISKSHIPFPHRRGNLYNMQYLVRWNVSDVQASEEHIHWVRKLYRYMEPHVSKHPRRAYLNYRDLDIGINRQANTSYIEARVWGEKYFMGNFKRLAQVKSRVDPDNFFRNEQSIPAMKHSK